MNPIVMPTWMFVAIVTVGGLLLLAVFALVITLIVRFTRGG